MSNHGAVCFVAATCGMDDFNKLLVEATAAVPSQYVHVPVAGLDVPAYRERVY